MDDVVPPSVIRFSQAGSNYRSLRSAPLAEGVAGLPQNGFAVPFRVRAQIEQSR